MDTFSIGQASSEVGVSAKAIRLWEAKGLIPPAKRTSSRYRKFSEADLSSMRFICQAKHLGLTLDDIKRILETRQAGAEPCDEVWELIDRRIADIDCTIAELSRLRATLDATRCNSQMPATDRGGNGVCLIIESADLLGPLQDRSQEPGVRPIKW